MLGENSFVDMGDASIRNSCAWNLTKSVWFRMFLSVWPVFQLASGRPFWRRNIPNPKYPQCPNSKTSFRNWWKSTDTGFLYHIICCNIQVHVAYIPSKKGKIDKYVKLRTKLILCCFCLTPLCFPVNGGVKGVMCFNLTWPLEFIISHDTGLLLCDLIDGWELSFFHVQFCSDQRSPSA